MNFCSFFFIDFGICLTEFLNFNFFVKSFAIKKFYLAANTSGWAHAARYQLKGSQAKSKQTRSQTIAV